MENDILSDLKRTMALFNKEKPSYAGLMYPSFGVSVPVFDSPQMTTTETYEETIKLTLWQRWIEPVSTFRNLQTMPFEPWVKTKVVQKTRTVPSRQILKTEYGLVMHPMLRREFSAIFSDVVA